MAFFNFLRTFDDKELQKHLTKNNISYTVDDQGMIDILPTESGYYHRLLIDHTQVNLQFLRSCGNLAILAQKVDLGALETVHANLSISSSEKVLRADQLKTVKGSLSASKTEMFSFNKLEIIDGNLHLPQATDVYAPEMEIVNGTIHTEKTRAFIADKLAIVNGDVNLSSAKTIMCRNLRKTGNINISDRFLPSAPGWFFSDTVIFGKNPTIYNSKTDLVKTDTKPWMTLAEIKEIVTQIYPSGQHHNQHMAFLNKFETATLHVR